MNVHARLCCLAHAGIEVSSHDPLWNYTNILSFVDLFLETISVLFVEVIKQFSSGVTIKDLWCRSETESPL